MCADSFSQDVENHCAKVILKKNARGNSFV